MNWVLPEGEAPPSASPPLCLLREAVPGMGKGGYGAFDSEVFSPIGLNTSAEVSSAHPGRLTHTLLCSHMCTHCVWQEHVKRHACLPLGRR